MRELTSFVVSHKQNKKWIFSFSRNSKRSCCDENREKAGKTLLGWKLSIALAFLVESARMASKSRRSEPRKCSCERGFLLNICTGTAAQSTTESVHTVEKLFYGEIFGR